MKVMSFFSGIGGNSLGYKTAGHEIIFANEFLKSSADTYEHNFGLEVCRDDIRTLDPEQLVKRYGMPDIIDGSPPCASYSMSGKREKNWGKPKLYAREHSQTTDDLLDEFLRMVFAIRPKMVCFENVVGLTTGESRKVLNDIYTVFTREGYQVKAQVLNAADYGVPQKRRRLFFRANLEGLPAPVFPKPTVKGKVIIKAFEGIVNTKEELDEVSIVNYSIYKKWLSLKQGETHPVNFNLTRVHPYKICPTVTALGTDRGSAGLCHWDEPRKFTYPEMLRLSGFPDDFEFVGPLIEGRERLGRVVCAPVMAELASCMNL